MGDPNTPGAPTSPPRPPASSDPTAFSGLGASDPSGPAAELDEELRVSDGVTVAAPPVVAVVVTRNAGPWLEPGLEALRDQDYPDLTVLVLDAGSVEDPTPRVAAVLPNAFVRRLEGDPGFATAVNQALSVVEGATFFFVCHDDVIPDSDAVRLMVEEAYRSNAAIVGPKLVDDTDPRILLEVGMAIDRFGSPHSEIEPDELDQAQHDAVRDVFYVSSAAMLLRVDLLAELGGFDPEAYPGSEDLDLCWRARIAGARVLVAPDARVRHREAAAERGIDDAPSANDLERSRLRSVLVAYSRPSLVLMVPWTIVHTFVESIAFLVTRRGDRAVALWRAWLGNLRRLKDLRGARARAQALRRVPDRELRALQTRGSARARRFIARRFRAEETVLLIGDTSRAVADRAQRGARQPIYLALALAALVFAVGSRGLFFDGIPQIGQFATWGGVSELLATFGGGWRETLLGSPTPAPPAFAVMAALAAPLLGASGLAETVLVLACAPIGVIGVMRLVRAASGEWVSAATGGLAYALLPVWRNAIANGRLGPLVLFALAPFVVHVLLMTAGARVDGGSDPSRLRRRWLSLVLLATLVSAFYPPALLLGIAVVLALILAAPLVGGVVLAARTLAATLVAAVGAAILLFPWPMAVALGGADPGAVGLGFRPRLDLGEMLRMSSGPAGARWSAIALLVGGALALAIARGPRLTWAVRAWALALVGFAATWLPARFAPEIAVPAPEATLAVFALGIAVAVGLGVAAFVEDLRGQHFGWRQGVSLVTFFAIAVSSLGFIGDSITGRWHAPSRDWPDALAFAAQDELGSFRVLWVGEPTVLPFDAVVEDDGIGYVLTVNGAGDITDALRAPTTDADDVLGDALTRARERKTAHLGRILAPMAVRYVIVPDRIGPRAGTRAAPPADLVAGLDAQIDLGKLVRTDDELRVYENTAWIPMEAQVGGELPDDAERDDLRLAEPGEDDAEVDEQAATRTLLWSQAANDGWRASAGGEELERFETFGWANGFAIDDQDEASISWQRQWQRNATVLLQLAILVVVLSFVWRRRPGPGRGTRAERRIRGRGEVTTSVDDAGDRRGGAT